MITLNRPTYNPPPLATQQEIFDHVVRHLGKQRKRAGKIARDAEGVPSMFLCRYRADDGAACAIGCLISDAVYAELVTQIETQPVDMLTNTVIGELREAQPAFAFVEYGDSGTLLSRLQSAHDMRPQHGPASNASRPSNAVEHEAFEAAIVAEWPARLRAVAVSFGLSDAVVAEAFA